MVLIVVITLLLVNAAQRQIAHSIYIISQGMRHNNIAGVFINSQGTFAGTLVDKLAQRSPIARFFQYQLEVLMLVLPLTVNHMP